MELAKRVIDWVAQGGAGDPDLGSENFTAARVEIRFEGLLAGEGQAIGSTALSTAAKAAMEGLRRHTRGAVEGLGDSLAVSVELGRDWVPLSEPELASPDLMLPRGVDSLGIRRGEDSAAVFASTLHSVSPVVRPLHQELSTLAAQLLSDPLASAVLPANLQTERGVRFYRFEAEHWAQAGPGGRLMLLHRGADLIPEREAWQAGFVERLATDLVGHLAYRAGRSGRDRWAPIHLIRCEIVAEPVSDLSRATVLLALTRAAQSPSLDRETRDRVGRAADALWEEFSSEEGDLLPQVAAMLWVAGLSGKMPEPLAGRVDASLDSVLGQLESLPWSGSPSEAIGLWALASRAGDAETRRQVGNALGEVVAARGIEGMVSLQPWAAWADAALHPDGGALQSQAPLREMRDVMWANQFGSLDVGRGSEDFVGGLVFASAGLPSATTLRPLAFAAWALGDPRLTTQNEVMGGPERRGELLRVLGGLRFVRQLTIDEASAYRSALPAAVVGGVRRTLWDSTIHAEDTAMGLLACLETIESMHKRVGGNRSDPE